MITIFTIILEIVLVCRLSAHPKKGKRVSWTNPISLLTGDLFCYIFSISINWFILYITLYGIGCDIGVTSTIGLVLGISTKKPI